MSLAQRVRDYRYAKGWGPDELASRAEISRTALYQIESGKTGLPRAGTLRRIAVALDVSMDDLLGHVEVTQPQQAGGRSATSVPVPLPARSREVSDWIPSEGGPLNLPSPVAFNPFEDEEAPEPSRFAVETQRRAAIGFEGLVKREGELMSKLHDLLHSPLGAGVARIMDELHVILPRLKSST